MSGLAVKLDEDVVDVTTTPYDFTLVKFEPPTEFQLFGALLSARHRKEAEAGSIHRTARRLAALFESAIPSTPHLVKAYGIRASAIAAQPDINPIGTRDHGPFTAFVGVDGASLWAAVTSAKSDSKTHAPLAIHLLACLLARVWKPAGAVSIWVELVQGRQTRIEQNRNEEPRSVADCMAAQQTILRHDLANWDASARAWLQSADEACEASHRQLLLVLNKMHIQLPREDSTYDNIMSVWKNSLTGMETIIRGVPQNVTDGTILLAVSAWHTYPDLEMEHEKSRHIHFRDALVDAGGILTFGRQFESNSRPTGMQWSLALSHLRYYGGPVRVELSSNTERVSIKHLLVMVFGHLLSSWSVPQIKEISCARWIVNIGNLMPDSAIQAASCYPYSSPLSYLSVLKRCAEIYLQNLSKNPETIAMFTKWGRSRCQTFLGAFEGASLGPPQFGFGCLRVLNSLDSANTLEAGIKYLRDIVNDLGLGEGDAIIRNRIRYGRGAYIQLITARPHQQYMAKRSAEGLPKYDATHCRWLVDDANRDSLLEKPGHCTCDGPCGSSCWCAARGVCCSAQCQCRNHRDNACSQVGPWLAHMEANIRSSTGEECRRLPSENLAFDPGRVQRGVFTLTWTHPPPAYHNHRIPTAAVSLCPTLRGPSCICRCFDACHEPTEYYHPAVFRRFYGTSAFGLYLRVRPESHEIQRVCQDLTRRVTEMVIQPTHAADMDTLFERVASMGKVPLTSPISAHIQAMGWNDDCVASADTNLMPSGIELCTLMNCARPARDYLRALKNLSWIVDIYDNLNGATIPMEALSLSLANVSWQYAKPTWPRDRRGEITRRGLRAESFACIAMLETGNSTIQPEEYGGVIAIACSNSIYVALELLTDPALHTSVYVHRLAGSTGMPGISVLVSPDQTPLTKQIPPAINDGLGVDNFDGTSLTLSFTGRKKSMQLTDKRNIDDTSFWVETVVAVHDHGWWTADLDLSQLDSATSRVLTYRSLSSAGYVENDLGGDENIPVVHIRSWAHVLDPPGFPAIIHTRENWVARLAIAAIMPQLQPGIEVRLVNPVDNNLCRRSVGRCMRAHGIMIG